MTTSTVDAGTADLGPDRPRLAVRRRGGPRRPFLLVHGLASNARLWDGVGEHLAAAGHATLAVDLRGHGLSPATDDGNDTTTAADDLAALIAAEGLTGARAPIAVGQSWGGNVVLALAARHPGSVAAVACVDGGWIGLGGFAGFEDCWAALAPPRLDGVSYDQVARWIATQHPGWAPTAVEATLANLVRLPDGVRARLDRDHHRSILRSLYEEDPADRYPHVNVPVLLVPALGPTPGDDDDARRAGARAAVLAALDALPDARVVWYPGADHDLHAQYPERLAADLLSLASRAEAPQAADVPEEAAP